MERFLTINQAGRLETLPPVGTLRRMVKQGCCPGFYSGSRYYVDVQKLLEQLDAAPISRRQGNDA